jgi:uncharacterized protein (DUF488 family)
VIVFTVGHGTRELEELASVLKAAKVELLVDVRRFPASRRHPHFSRESLEISLPEMGLRYEWREAFGGRRKPAADSPNVAWRNDAFRGYADHMRSPEFREALDRLKDGAAKGPTAVMCAETLWWRCHRRLIADALVAGGAEVVHLGMGRDDRHKLNQAARIDPDGLLVYDVES